MKLKELLREADKIEMVEITIGYDDHCSIYLVPVAALDKLSKMKNSGDVNDTIVDNYNRKYTGDNDPCDKGEIFLDNTEHTNSLDEFRQQIKDYKKENLAESVKLGVRGSVKASRLRRELTRALTRGSDKPWDKNKPNEIRETLFSGKGLDVALVYNKQEDRVLHIVSWGGPSDEVYNTLIAAVERTGGQLFDGKSLMQLTESTIKKSDKLDAETEKHLEETMAKLSSIKDLDEAKKIAHEFLNKMKFQEKAEKYKNLVNRAKNVKDVIKFVYDVKLAGEGLGVIK